MDQTILLNLLERVLGKSTPTNNDNYKFFCPNCKHKKKKLEINLITQQWACWVCGNKGFKGKTINSLIKKINPSEKIIKEFKNLDIKPVKKQHYSEFNEIKLPEEYISLNDISKLPILQNISAKHALKYLRSRGINQECIEKYNIGFCDEGKYYKRIIIPSYDENGKLNYFIARNFNDDFQPYKNPPGSQNIIGFEYFINWNLPIILCEGIFDAITIKRNVIPLFGKVIHEALIKKIITSKVQKIYIALDKDAIKDALIHSEYLMHMGKEVYLVEIKGKDPNKMGFENFTKLISKTFPLTLSQLYKNKIQLI